MTKWDLFRECKIGLRYKNHSVSYMRSLAPGQNCVCDLSGLTKGNYKGFICQASEGKAAHTTHTHTPQIWCTAVKTQSLIGVASLDIFVFMNTCILSSRASIKKPLYQRNLSQGLSQMPLPNPPYLEGLKNTFLHSGSVLNIFPLLGLLLLLLHPRAHKSSGLFYLGSLSIAMAHSICDDTFDLLAPFHGKK